MSKIKKTGMPSIGKDVEEPGISYAADGNIKCYNYSGKEAVSFLKN